MEPSIASPLIKLPLAKRLPEGDNARHLLRSMHQVFSHDLPNQVLVMQTLLQMLELEEMEHLGDDGKEQVKRLQLAVGKTSRMVRFLKEMSRLQACTPQKDDVSFERLMRDVNAELYQQFPEAEVEFVWHPDNVLSFEADPRLLTCAIVELIGISLEDSPDSQVVRWEAKSEWSEGEVEIQFSNQSSQRANSYSTSRKQEPRMSDGHLELLLASEWLRWAGARLQSPNDPMVRQSFTLLVPGGTCHG
jgi:light-regulated signal transduction histidine kinase (bacteriophytochrome)